jgi:predicted RNA binding protein YcfA (HicA-like mRNA interferase family)
MRYYCGVDRQELRRRIARRPKAVRFSELQQVLEAYGWVLERVRGSHHLFVKDGGRLVIPLRRPHVLPAYVREVIEATVEEEDESPDDDSD